MSRGKCPTLVKDNDASEMMASMTRYISRASVDKLELILCSVVLYFQLTCDFTVDKGTYVLHLTRGVI